MSVYLKFRSKIQENFEIQAIDRNEHCTHIHTNSDPCIFYKILSFFYLLLLTGIFVYVYYVQKKLGWIIQIINEFVVYTYVEGHLGYNERICQWILGSLDGLFWKSIVSRFLTKSILFIFGAPINFFWPEKTLFCIRNPNFLGGGGVVILQNFRIQAIIWSWKCQT